MDDLTVKKPPFNWLIAGIILAMIQILAVGIKKPLGVSTQFVVIDSIILHNAAPEYASQHPLINQPKYTTLGYGFWLDIGIIAGAGAAALILGEWKLRTNTIWSAVNGIKPAKRLLISFIAGFLIIAGARLAHGCTSGQFASGWTQLSLSVVPFTITMFGFGIAAAFLIYKKNPEIEK